MTKEREAAIRRECKAEVYKPVRIDKSTTKDPDDHAWGISGPAKIGTVWFKNNLSDCEGYCRFLNTVHAEGMFGERLRAEDLVEAMEIIRDHTKDVTAKMLANDALDQYRRKP